MDDLINWFIPVFVSCIAAEAWIAARAQLEVFERRDTLACLAMGLGNVIITLPLKFFWLWLYVLVYQFRLFTIPLEAVWGWVVLFFADDFCYYWFHRMHHQVRMLWCTHVNHHSSERYTLAVALRQPWTEPLTAYWFWLPLPLVGFDPRAVIIQQSINLVYQFFIHTQTVKSLGPLEHVLNTPSHHRVHHGTNAQYLDRNFGGILIIWDKLFGSFEPEREPVRYGITHNLATFNPVRIAFHEWAAMARQVAHARSWRDRRVALFGTPEAAGTLAATNPVLSNASVQA